MESDGEVILYREGKEGLFSSGDFEQSPEGNDKASHENMQERKFHLEGTTSAKVLRHIKKAKVARAR